MAVIFRRKYFVVTTSHDSVSRFLIETIDSLLNRYPTFDVMLCGDFNRLKVDDICSNCNLYNLHNQTTYGDAELDYVLISESAASFYTVCKVDPIDISAVSHASLLAIPAVVKQNNLNLSRPFYDLRSSNVRYFVNQLECSDWSFLMSDFYNVHEKCDMFHRILNGAFDNTIPVKYVTFTNNTKPWITPLVKSLINDRWTAYRQKNFQLYNHLKLKVKKEIENSKVIWAMKMKKKKNVWKTTNEILGRKTNDPMKCFYNRFDSLLSAANFINNGFSSVFSEKLPISVPDAGHNRISVTEAQVFTLLKNLPSNKASPEIPPKLYKAAAGILAKPLTALIQQSISDSIVPDSWKISAVIPLPKSSSPSNTDELRPISLLPIPAKILERVILEFAKPYLLKEYGSDQYGFRNGSSTTCALINLHDHITKYLDITSVAGVQVIVYDFSKAFDRIKHDIIIKYLTACNMPAELISWISSYLTHRRQYVKIGTVHSLTKEVTSGVPQGSILGPFLFSVVVGSLTISNNDCRVIKYADDVTISIPIFKNRKNLHVSEIHETVVKWSSEYGLPLNTKKCKTLLIPVLVIAVLCSFRV